jgi:hypothetical protein
MSQLVVRTICSTSPVSCLAAVRRDIQEFLSWDSWSAGLYAYRYHVANSHSREATVQYTMISYYLYCLGSAIWAGWGELFPNVLPIDLSAGRPFSAKESMRDEFSPPQGVAVRCIVGGVVGTTA